MNIFTKCAVLLIAQKNLDQGNSVITLNTILPQLFLKAIKNDVVSLKTIMLVWAFFAFASLVIGSLIYPWHNLPQHIDNENQFQIRH